MAIAIRGNIIREIQRLHARRAPLNISAVKRSHPKLIERVYAVRPYWGWKRALESAGLDYAKINVELRDYVDCKICGRDFGLSFHLIDEHDKVRTCIPEPCHTSLRYVGPCACRGGYGSLRERKKSVGKHGQGWYSWRNLPA